MTDAGRLVNVVEQTLALAGAIEYSPPETEIFAVVPRPLSLTVFDVVNTLVATSSSGKNTNASGVTSIYDEKLEIVPVE